jgi:glutamate 5-kinase
LAALVALLIQADLLILVSDIDALYDAPPSQSGAQVIRNVAQMADIEGIALGGAGSAGVGSGGNGLPKSKQRALQPAQEFRCS